MRSTISAALAIALLVAIGYAARETDTAAQEQPDVRFQRVSLSWTERETSFRFVDEAPRTRVDREGNPRRISPGDGFVSRKTVLDPQRRRMGTVEEQCTITNGGASLGNLRSVCAAVVRLRDGQLYASLSPDFGSEERTAGVTGGTGAYAGATGTISGRQEDPVVRADLIVPVR
jgi:hypothetical protein